MKLRCTNEWKQCSRLPLHDARRLLKILLHTVDLVLRGQFVNLSISGVREMWWQWLETKTFVQERVFFLFFFFFSFVCSDNDDGDDLDQYWEQKQREHSEAIQEKDITQIRFRGGKLIFYLLLFLSQLLLAVIASYK